MFDLLSEKFAHAFKAIRGQAKITESNIQQALADVRTALLEADVNFKVVKGFIENVKEKALGAKVLRGVNPEQQFTKIVQDELAHLMGVAHQGPSFEGKRPLVVLVVGLNGQGKTTFSGKLALFLSKKKSKRVLLVPADTFRPAAKTQLQVLASQAQVDCFDADVATKTPVAIVREALSEAKTRDVVIIDTAGRLHVDDELMGQLAHLKESLSGENLQVFMVADAMAGQEAVQMAKTFHERVGITGVVLSKMDSDARGGAALSIRQVTGIPITYMSTGEKLKDLELFHPDRLASRILDQGDVVSLVEKAQEEIDEKEAEGMMKRLERGLFTVEDLVKQMNMMNKLGSMTSLLKMVPGMGGVLRQVGDLSPAEGEMGAMKVIIGSMTKQERRNYKIIGESRLERIARGSGHSSQKVKDFLTKFSHMEKMMGQMGQMMKGGGPQAAPSFKAPGVLKKAKKGKGRKGPWGHRYF